MVDVTLKDLRKEYGDIVAVEGFNLTIHEDEFITLVGPSGCGKTTTLRMVAGLATPTSGQLLYGDQDVTDLPIQERDIALLFQDIALYPHMTVRENMAYGLKIAGVDKETRYEKVRDAAEMLQISDLLDNNPSELSGGQQQRVALGRSIVRDPTVFLFDEPMSDLDAKLKRELRPLFEEVTREIGCPTLYVTHDQEEAMTMSDRIVVMDDGEIAQVGEPEEVYNEPDSEFVGSFMGQPTMQFFDAKVKHNGGTKVVVDDEEFDMTGEEAVEEYTGEDIRLGIRPQNIDVTEGGEGGIHATHQIDEPLGDETHSFFDTDKGRITVVTPPGFNGNGKQYRLHIDPERVKLFDSDSGIRVY